MNAPMRVFCRFKPKRKARPRPMSPGRAYDPSSMATAVPTA